MKQFIEGADLEQAALFPDQLDDYVNEDNLVRVINAFGDALNLTQLDFDGMSEATGRLGYHPADAQALSLWLPHSCSNLRADWGMSAVATLNSFG